MILECTKPLPNTSNQFSAEDSVYCFVFSIKKTKNLSTISVLNFKKKNEPSTEVEFGLNRISNSQDGSVNSPENTHPPIDSLNYQKDTLPNLADNSSYHFQCIYLDLVSNGSQYNVNHPL
jgi:hypothetical protein